MPGSQSIYNYRIFDVTVASDFELPELCAVASAKADLQVCLETAGRWPGHRFERTHEWRDRDGSVFCRVGRWQDDFLFEFPGYVSFYIDPAGLIRCRPEPGCPPEVVRHTLIDQAIPRLLASQGRLLLHASVVALEPGRAVAFLGRSGFGKSTLAASFGRAGRAVLADDCVMVDVTATGVELIGPYPGLRLWPDSLAFEECSGEPKLETLQRVTPLTDKRRVQLGSSGGAPGAERPERFELTALLALNDPSDPAHRVQTAPLRGAQAFQAVVNHLFRLDAEEDTTVAHFAALTSLLRRDVQVFALAYPRQWHQLDEVIHAVDRLLATSLGSKGETAITMAT